MTDVPKPGHYKTLESRFPAVMSALEELGKAVRDASPHDRQTTHLIQLAAAAAMQHEGAVHSHARRALAAGVDAETLIQTALLLTSTIGFPKVAATVSWIEDVTE